MAIIGDALRQAFMPKYEYDSLREEEKAWSRLQRPIITVSLTVLCLAVLVSVFISLNIVFPADEGKRPFCRDRRLQPLSVNFSADSDLFPRAFYLTEQEAADYYWMVVFMPSAIIFFVSVVYLLAGGVRCLSILNSVFAVIFGLLALFLGSTLLTLGSSCSLPLFWCYEIASWGLVVLYGGTAFFLRRKAAVVLDEGEFAGRSHGLEMLEAASLDVTPEVERRVNEGFKAWMGSSLLSSDEEDNSDEYQEVQYPMRTNSSRQRPADGGISDSL
ncbi:PREDICTED: uncharacterized protein LOC104595166 isoform X2 [Nelumbo nucifera]|uniref:Uncharacterized protein LOC104595166 isoform X2 n=1 Tax=Nelumbo nucifera TaxID=4432 RepID=A0A1U7ZQ98_NELNU|nr:PREDICTED: uncharacterized protein LOC104595166 isoform X2 [Nelumbo nucifera]